MRWTASEDRSPHSLGVSDHELWRFDEEMMDEPNYYLELLADKADAVRENVQSQAKRWSELTEREKQILRADNVLAKKKQRAAQQRTEKAEQQAEQDAFNTDLQAYKADRRKAFPGTDEQFAKIWPKLEEEFLLSHAKPDIERIKQDLLKSGRYS